MSSKATAHLGTCTHCAGEGDVITIEADPLPLSLCPACLALIISNASGIRRAIRERWALLNRRAAAQRGRRLAELARKARVDVERLAKMDQGTGPAV